MYVHVCVCMYVCVYVCMYVCVCIPLHLCMSMRIFVLFRCVHLFDFVLSVRRRSLQLCVYLRLF